MVGWPVWLRLPNDIIFRPCASMGRRRPFARSGSLREPVMTGTEGPRMSASSSPTVAPLWRSAAARLTATVDLPTPPLPDATAIVCFTPGRTSDGFGRENAGRTLAVMRTSTPVTPAIAWTASSACDLKRSRTGQAGVVSSKVKLTLPCGLTSRSLTMPKLVAYYGGPASDVYFQRARKTLAGARVDAVVAMDFFAGDPGVLCGVA